jgi:hypothetical protein
MDNYQYWYNRQSKSTQVWIDSHASWGDHHIFALVIAALALGILIGWIL